MTEVVVACDYPRPPVEGREDLGGRDDRGRDMPPWHAKRRFVPPPSSSAKLLLACGIRPRLFDLLG